MGVVVGRRRLPREAVSITNGHEQIQFGSPADFMEYLRAHPELEEELRLSGMWAWATDDPDGGH